MGADITQGTPSLPGTRQSTQIAARSAPYHGAVTSMVTQEATALRCRRSPLTRALAAHLSGPHLRLPDECARLRAAGRVAGSRRIPARGRRKPTPTSSCSTPARSARTPTTSCTATSAISRRASRPTPTCRSPSAAAWRRRTATPSCARPRGSTSCSAPTTSGRCRRCSTAPATTAQAQVEIVEALEEFPSALPAARESAYAAWVSISVGCNNTCTFCIVPALRGKEVDRRPGDVLAEVQSLVDQGVLEVTLLGQNVNAYGVSFADPDQPRDRGAFAKLLRACGRIDGLERVRFTSPHPAEFTDDVIDAMAETPNVCPTLHMPLQSGSDRILRAMRRSYRAETLPRHHRAGAGRDPARRDHHRPHRRVPRRDRRRLPGHARRGRARRGSPARSPSSTRSAQAPRPPSCDGPAAESRCARTLSTADRPSGEDLAGGEHRADRAHRRAAGGHGRRPQGRQHRTDVGTRPRRPAGAFPTRQRLDIRPGDIVTTTVTGAAPHHLIADGGPHTHRRTRAGDAHAAGQKPRTGVGLGMPSIGVPARQPTSSGCGPVTAGDRNNGGLRRVQG